MSDNDNFDPSKLNLNIPALYLKVLMIFKRGHIFAIKHAAVGSTAENLEDTSVQKDHRPIREHTYSSVLQVPRNLMPLISTSLKKMMLVL